MIKSVTITADATRVTWERNPGEAIYVSRIWYIPHGETEWKELTDITPTRATPAQVEESIRVCTEKGYTVTVDDPDAAWDGREQDH